MIRVFCLLILNALVICRYGRTVFAFNSIRFLFVLQIDFVPYRLVKYFREYFLHALYCTFIVTFNKNKSSNSV